MLSRDENERLVRVGPGTPAGTLFRRYWQPACLSTELAERDGATPFFGRYEECGLRCVYHGWKFDTQRPV